MLPFTANWSCSIQTSSQAENTSMPSQMMRPQERCNGQATVFWLRHLACIEEASLNRHTCTRFGQEAEILLVWCKPANGTSVPGSSGQMTEALVESLGNSCEAFSGHGSSCSCPDGPGSSKALPPEKRCDQGEDASLCHYTGPPALNPKSSTTHSNASMPNLLLLLPPRRLAVPSMVDLSWSFS